MYNADIERPIKVNEIVEAIGLVEKFAGKHWVEKKKRQISRHNKPRRLFHSIYKKGPHPLITLILESEQALTQIRSGHRKNIPEPIARCLLLAQNIWHCQNCKGFDDRIGDNIKKTEEYASTYFELEVAAYYITLGHEVEFLKETKNQKGVRTPDLLVRTNEQQYFHVECKHKETTARESRVNQIWQEVEKKIYDYLHTNHLNFLVIINAKTDPERQDVEQLVKWIRTEIDKARELKPNSNEFPRYICNNSSKYEVKLRKICENEVITQGSLYELDIGEELDKLLFDVSFNPSKHIQSPFNINLDGETHMLTASFPDDTQKVSVSWKNPSFIGFRCDVPPDRVIGVKQSFKDAVGQIPDDSWGIIWINLPFYRFKYQVDQDTYRAQKLIENEFASYHKNIHGVMLKASMFNSDADSVLSQMFKYIQNKNFNIREIS